ncbi:MAG: hypothetical protein QUS11_02920 [Candidatus Fermentibacter sp.]|nr:hypothetical protein [Candidatus Fermentibacter sp.]
MLVSAFVLSIMAGGVQPAWISLPGSNGPVVVSPVRIELGEGPEGAALTLPVLLGDAGDSAVDAINEALSWESMTGEPLEETISTYREIERGFVGASFTVNYNEGGILDITVTTDFYGAYPSTEDHLFRFETSTGERLAMRDLLDDSREAELAGILDGMLQENIEAARGIYCDGDDDSGMYDGYSFGVEDLDRATIVGDGVQFRYDFGFPHVALAAEPEGDLFLMSQEMEPFLAVR